MKHGDIYLLKEEKPKVDPTIDKYAVLARFLDEMKINGNIQFEIEKKEFEQLQRKLNQLNSTETEMDLVDIIELNVNGRIFKFKIKK